MAHTLANPGAFFVGVRKVTGMLDQAQVDIINRLIVAAAEWGAGWLAYGLATAWHEARMKPIEEWGRGKGLPYGKPGRNGGQVPYGRGLVQLTHDDNYERADRELGLKGALTRNYEMALDHATAVSIMVEGMTEGWFTGKKLADYIGTGLGLLPEFMAARRIINGNDRAALIGGYAVRFQDALIAGGWA